jgi:hypothetical protein
MPERFDSHLAVFVVVLSAGLLASGCGGTTRTTRGIGGGVATANVTPQSLGSCDANARYSLASAQSQLDDASTSWFDVTSGSIASGALTMTGPPTSLRTTSKSPQLTGSERLQVVPDYLHRIQATGAPDSGRFIVGVDANELGDRIVTYLALQTSADEIAFVGTCEYETLTRPLQVYADAHSMSQADLVLEVLKNPSGTTASAFFSGGTSQTTIPWTQRDPSQRVIDPADTPKQIFDRLGVQTVIAEVPTGWADAGWVLCARSSEGWGECSDISAAASLGGSNGTLRLTMRAYFDAGASYEVVLKQGDSLDGSVRVLTAVDPGTASKGASVGLTASGTLSAPTAVVTSP